MEKKKVVILSSEKYSSTDSLSNKNLKRIILKSALPNKSISKQIEYSLVIHFMFEYFFLWKIFYSCAVNDEPGISAVVSAHFKIQ